MLKFLRLHTFAHHVRTIATTTAPTVFTLTPVPGVVARVVIEPSGTEDSGNSVWDQVWINGKHCGNRSGGIDHFTNLVNDAKPEIDFS